MCVIHNSAIRVKKTWLSNLLVIYCEKKVWYYKLDYSKWEIVEEPTLCSGLWCEKISKHPTTFNKLIHRPCRSVNDVTLEYISTIHSRLDVFICRDIGLARRTIVLPLDPTTKPNLVCLVTLMTWYTIACISLYDREWTYWLSMGTITRSSLCRLKFNFTN